MVYGSNSSRQQVWSKTGPLSETHDRFVWQGLLGLADVASESRQVPEDTEASGAVSGKAAQFWVPVGSAGSSVLCPQPEARLPVGVSPRHARGRVHLLFAGASHLDMGREHSPHFTGEKLRHLGVECPGMSKCAGRRVGSPDGPDFGRADPA